MGSPCCFCLSTDRRLVPVNGNHQIHLKLLNFELLSEGAICWECEAVILRIAAFRQQVLMAQKKIQNFTATPAELLTSLSKLSQIHKNEYDCVFTEGSDPFFNINVIIDIKTEASTSFELDNEQHCDRSETIASKNIDQLKEEATCNDERCESDLDPFHSKYCLKPLTLEELQGIKTEASTYIEIETEEHHDRSETIQSENIDQLKEEAPCNDERCESDLDPFHSSYCLKPMTMEELQGFQEIDRKAPKYASAPFKCESCITGYYSIKKYDNHMKNSHKELYVHMCNMCKCTFADEQEMKSHYDSHFKLFVCKMCGHQTTKKKQIMLHYNNVHRYTTYKCYHCQQEFSTRHALRYHRIKMHTDMPICETCGKKCKTKSDLKRHVQSHKGTERHQCPICLKWLKGRSGLQAHVRAHAPSNDDAYCAECDIRFKRYSVYRQHVKFSSKHRQENDNPQFECHDCGRKFSLKQTLKIHIMSVHLKKSEIICQFCGKHFFRQDRLRDHIKYVHEGAEKVKDKICTYCWKAFGNRTILRIHLRTHTGEKPYRCDQCGAGFTQRGTMMTHVRGVHLKIRK